MKRFFKSLFQKKVTNEWVDFFNSSLDGFLFTDENGHIKGWNKAIEKIIGIPFKTFYGIKLWEFPLLFEIKIDNQIIDKKSVKDRLISFFETGKSINDHEIAEMELIMTDGSKKWIQQTSFKIDSPRGIRLGTVVRDITHQKNLVLRLRKNENSFHDLERLFNTIENFLFIVDLNGNIIHVNDVVLKRLGYSFEELYKKPVIMVHPKTRQEEVGYIIGDILKGSLNTCFVPFETKSGNLIPVETRVMFGKWKDREVLIGTSWDITKILSTERALSDSEAKYKNLIENTGEGIGIVDNKEIFVFANDAAEEIFGEKKGELVGKSVLSYISEEDIERILQQTQRRKRGEKSTYELTIRQPGGALREVLLTATPNYDDKGEITGTMGIFRDNTELKNALDLMTIAKEKAEENDRVKSAFLSTMSHELRTPLNAIIGLSELIESCDNWDEIHEFTQIINLQGNGLLEIIESIFEIIQLETEDADVDVVEIELNSFFNSLVSKFENRRSFHKKENIELCYNPDENCKNPVILSDRKKLKIVIENLVDNALKFTKEGFVEYGYKRIDDSIEFFVSDSGVGIDESKKHVIFERFRQADDSHTREFGGIGLGLAICQKIADRMGAELDFRSKSGEGTTFFFILPGVIDPAQYSDNNILQSYKLPDLYNHKILIAEDERANLRLITSLIGRCNGQVVTACNGTEAVKLADTNPDISLVIMDINMPVMDGITAMKLIKKHYPDVPVVALTAYALPRDKRRFIDSGFDDMLTKPIRNINLLKIVSKFLLPHQTNDV